MFLKQLYVYHFWDNEKCSGRTYNLVNKQFVCICKNNFYLGSRASSSALIKWIKNHH